MKAIANVPISDRYILQAYFTGVANLIRLTIRDHNDSEGLSLICPPLGPSTDNVHVLNPVLKEILRILKPIH